MKNLTLGQWLAIILGVLGVLSGATVQLTDLLGAGAAKSIVTIANLAQTIMGAILVAITGQSAQVRAVQDMPGVEKIVVNANANNTLATLAVDPTQQKIEPAPNAVAAVQAKAQET